MSETRELGSSLERCFDWLLLIQSEYLKTANKCLARDVAT